MDSKNKLVLDKSILEDIKEFIEDPNVTDIDWDGDKLVITDVEKGCYKSDISLSQKFIENISVKLSNLINQNFNKQSPVLEAEMEDLRISMYHESVLSSGRSISIRKTPLFARLNREEMLTDNYCTSKILNLCENSIKAHMNIFIGGLPGVGKTELLKFLAKDIPDNEKILTIEDTRELHMKFIYPEKHIVDLKVGKDDANFNYDTALSSILRHNAKWTILSESRGKEVYHLFNNLSNGTHCLTTIHLNDFRKFPDRVISMMGEVVERYIDNVYQFVDMGILVDKYINDEGKVKRKITQIVYLSRENGENKLKVIYENGVLYKEMIPEEIMDNFSAYNIEDPFVEAP